MSLGLIWNILAKGHVVTSTSQNADGSQEVKLSRTESRFPPLTSRENAQILCSAVVAIARIGTQTNVFFASRKWFVTREIIFKKLTVKRRQKLIDNPCAVTTSPLSLTTNHVFSVFFFFFNKDLCE